MQPEGMLPPSPADEPEALMLRYQAGDRTAARLLVERLSAQLLLFFSTQMGSRQEAEDMLQEAWLRLHRVRHTYRPGEPLLPWVYAIARRVRVDHYRRRSRIERREVATGTLPETAAAETRHELPAFEELMSALPESQREVVTMLKAGGMTIEEVARATASTTGAVKQKAHRAYERLRVLLTAGGAK